MNSLPLLPVAVDKLELVIVISFMATIYIHYSEERIVLKDLFQLFQYVIIPT